MQQEVPPTPNVNERSTPDLYDFVSSILHVHTLDPAAPELQLKIALFPFHPLQVHVSAPESKYTLSTPGIELVHSTVTDSYGQGSELETVIVVTSTGQLESPWAQFDVS